MHNTVILVLSCWHMHIVQGMYFVSSVLLMRMNMPVAYRYSVLSNYMQSRTQILHCT